MKIHSVGAVSFHAVEQTEIEKLIVAFRSFGNAFKKLSVSITKPAVSLLIYFRTWHSRRYTVHREEVVPVCLTETTQKSYMNHQTLVICLWRRGNKRRILEISIRKKACVLRSVQRYISVWFWWWYLGLLSFYTVHRLLFQEYKIQNACIRWVSSLHFPGMCPVNTGVFH